MNDLNGLEDSIINLMFNEIGTELLILNMNVLSAILKSEERYPGNFYLYLGAKKELHRNQRSKKEIRIASFANSLASQPNIISKDEQKEVKKERLIEARERLKVAKELWKQKPKKHPKG